MKKKKYYKLIKEYPGSPKLGTIAHEDKYNPNKYYTALGEFAMLTQNTLDKFSEFWEKVVEEDYEILEYYQGEYTYSKSHQNWNYICEKGYPIKKIKRLSDGEVFTVGDKINGKCGENQEIIKIDTEWIYYRSNVKNKEIYTYRLNEISKSKKPLFTTKDGVDIYEGDKYWLIVNSDMAMPNTARKEWSYNSENKRFSTKKAAENYIKLHKPCLSYQEILSIFDTTCSNSSIRNDFKTKLTKLINIKI